jgi:hypothetical protein
MGHSFFVAMERDQRSRARGRQDYLEFGIGENSTTQIMRGTAPAVKLACAGLNCDEGFPGNSICCALIRGIAGAAGAVC